jgi:hypothetical protein
VLHLYACHTVYIYKWYMYVCTVCKMKLLLLFFGRANIIHYWCPFSFYAQFGHLRVMKSQHQSLAIVSYTVRLYVRNRHCTCIRIIHIQSIITIITINQSYSTYVMSGGRSSVVIDERRVRTDTDRLWDTWIVSIYILLQQIHYEIHLVLSSNRC